MIRDDPPVPLPPDHHVRLSPEDQAAHDLALQIRCPYCGAPRTMRCWRTDVYGRRYEKRLLCPKRVLAARRHPPTPVLSLPRARNAKHHPVTSGVGAARAAAPVKAARRWLRPSPPTSRDRLSVTPED